MLNKTTIKTDTCMHYNDKIKFNLVFKITNLTFQIIIENLRFTHVHLQCVDAIKFKTFSPFSLQKAATLRKKTSEEQLLQIF